MKYGEIFKEFKSKVKADVEDYRPCEPAYGVPYIYNSIVVWLKDGGRLIYTHEDREFKDLTERLYAEALWLENSMAERVE